MADFSQTIALLFRAQDQASTVMADVSRALDGLTKESATTGGQFKDLDKDSDILAGSLAALGRLAAGVFAGFSLAAVTREFITANIEAEKFARAMTVLTGSSEGAARELDFVRGVSNRLGLDVRSTSDAWVSLAAAARGTSLEGEQARRIFEAVSSAMSLLGRSSAETQGALLAIQQIISKGTVSSEELRGQLGERLPGAFQIAARAVGVTTQELGDLLQRGQLIADDFLPKFATEINRTFGNPGQVDTFVASFNRLKNAIEESLQAIGQRAGGLGGGGFDFLADATRRVALEAENQITTWRNLFDVLRGGSWDVFVAKQRQMFLELDQTRAVLDFGVNQTLAETERLLRQNASAATDFGDQFEAETARLNRQASAQAQAIEATAQAFKLLRVNPDDLRSDVQKIIEAFDTLARSTSVNADQLLAGLEASLKRITDGKDIVKLGESLKAAFVEGRLSLEEYDKGVALVRQAQDKFDKSTAKNVESLEKQARAAEKARESQERVRLELEKLASNERIKFIEARVAIDVARVQADTERVRAAFESINVTIDSTADIISKAFGALAGGEFIDSSTRNALFRQLDTENARRDRALQQQAELTQAQINLLRQQAQAMERGDALVKIDGAGLQPHLEAFMWEILKTIQVRVNRDGLGLLLGL